MPGTDLAAPSRTFSTDSILAHAWDAVIVLGPDGERLWVSPSIERLTGYAPDAYLALPPQVLCHPDDVPLVTRSLRACIENPEARPVYAHRIRHRDGSWRYVEAVATNALADPKIGGIVINARDVTDLETARAALRHSERRFRNAFHFAGIGKAIVGLDGSFVEVNSALCRITGYSAAELLSMTFQQITHPDDLEADLELAAALARREIPNYEMEKRYIRKDGGIAWIRLTGSLVSDDDGRPVHFIAQIQDISAQKRMEAELRERAECDALTGLLGRTAFQERLETALRSAESGTFPALALVDLDGFKEVNDGRGHHIGDAVLKAIAWRLRASLPDDAVIGRWGGDEFVVIFGDARSAEAWSHVVHAKMREPIALEDGCAAIGASIGIAIAAPGDMSDQLLRAADAAMYRDKRRARRDLPLPDAVPFDRRRRPRRHA